MRYILLLVLCAGLCAEDIKLKNGEVIRGVTEVRAKMRGLQITHETGIAMVPYAKLPEDLREKYAEAEKVNAEKLKRWKARRKKRAEIAGKKKIYLKPDVVVRQNEVYQEITDYSYHVWEVYPNGTTVRTRKHITIQMKDWRLKKENRVDRKEDPQIFVEGLPSKYTSEMEINEEQPFYECGSIRTSSGYSMKRYSSDPNAKPYDYTKKSKTKRAGKFLIVEE